MTDPVISYSGLKTDLYELTMAAGHFQNNVRQRAVFELFCHKVPAERPYLLCCGLEQAVEYIRNVRFSDEDIAFLREQPQFRSVGKSFFAYLKNFKFSGDLWAMPEGQVFFAREPVLQIEAPIIEAQILETYLLSVINIGSMVATKASRIVHAACMDGKGRGVVDFGSRRAHGPEAAILAARAAYIGGCAGTSNVYAGKTFGIPIFGTMAHSWVEAFDTEHEAFAKYFSVFPESTTLLIDTYDTLAGARKAIGLNKKIKGVRLDSGDIKTLSRQVRKILDRNSMADVKILASGNLNEQKISELVKAKAPVDIFGVGTDMVVSRDAPALDLTYKLVQVEDRGEVKFKAKSSQGKKTIAGRKQVFRKFDPGQSGKVFAGDVVGLFSEPAPAGSTALLELVIQGGRLLKPLPAIKKVRENAAQNLARLPSSYRKFRRQGAPAVTFSKEIRKLQKSLPHG
jgi:nicotinate phosphoribosyltransferase